MYVRPTCGVLLAWLLFDPEDGSVTFLRNVGLYEFHGVIVQKTSLFIFNAERTSNPFSYSRSY
jgi:hypothetical protein